MAGPTFDTFVGGGSGVGGRWTMGDLGWDDPVLLAQINAARGFTSDASDPPIGGSTITNTGTVPGYDPRPRGFDTTGLTTSAGALACNNINAGTPELTQILRDGCLALIKGAVNKIAGTSSSSGPCKEGYHTDPETGGCVIDGLGSYIPGDVGKPDYIWTPKFGRYGAGVTPVLVAVNRRECPAGFVVGKDGLCYDHLARTNRLHNPGAKPMLSGGDMNALRKAHSLQKQIGKIARRFGPKKAKVCPPTGKRK